MKEIHVIEIESGKVVRKIDVTGKSDHLIEKVERGLLLNMDFENYITEVVDVLEGK